MTKKRYRLAVQIGIVIAAAVFITLGFFRGEVQFVWNTAVNICLECIGLG